jgi:putative colanic acid biosysnthesis UDP-glucose lipid carrier transferase
MAETQANHSAAAFSRQSHPASLGNDNLLSLFELAVGPIALVLSLWGLAYYFEGRIDAAYIILSTLVFALTFPGHARLQSSIYSTLVGIVLTWCWIAGLLGFIAVASGYIHEFSKSVLYAWLWVAPLSNFAACLLLRAAAPILLKLQGPLRRAIIVGMNDQGLALASRIRQAPFARIELIGFVDDRGAPRIQCRVDHKLLGTQQQLLDLVKDEQIQIIYLSLPMASQPRILHILDELKDTTASIYFVPDMFVTDLIQAHPDSVCGMPVISVCETPFNGIDGAIKRLSDIVLATLILVLIMPLLIIIAVAVKIGSPGPIIFKQRRCGLDGKEIVIYKFRSMTVTEDGDSIAQATKDDARITPLGALLRQTSCDELPQFINVLQGHMSIVGPRPHAVAHNEIYRKLIKGYMVRHKVKPGITGWAQINGYRGETKTLDKMQSRIDYDLDYLRNWSVRLDLYIIFKTIGLVIKDQKAF